MKGFRDFPLHRKLTVVVVATTLVAMLVASVGIVWFQGVAARKLMVKELETTATIIGNNSAVALRFQVVNDGQRILESLAPKEHVVRACLLLPEGELFAEFSMPGETAVPKANDLGDAHEFTDKYLMLSRKIIHDGDLLGMVHLTSDLAFMRDQQRQTITTTILVLAGGMVLALFLSAGWLRAVSRPITDLVATAGRVSATGDYAVRARKYDDDDLGRLTAGFNEMLGQIQERDAELKKTQDELQDRVGELAAEKDRLTQSQGRERELIEKLSRSERLESLGLLAGGVAHDLNNILGPMVAYPELMLELLPEEEKRVRHMMHQIDDSAKKASGVIRNLLTMGRRGSYELEVVQLNDVIRSYCESPEFTEMQRNYVNVDLRLELAPDLWPIQASVSHLNQVVMNLVINAFEAVGRDKGEVVIRSERAGVNEPVDGYQTVEVGLYSKLTIRDNGCGIAREKLNRIFEPFFTGKKMGRSGSGLAVVYGVVQDFDGAIDVKSETGRGTSFEIFFPPLLEVQPAVPEPAESYPGSGRILVVDDVREQREMAAELLETMGYETFTAENGRRAVEFLQENDVDLVVLDMIMEEGFDGLDTYREIVEFKPGQKCIIASGFSESERVREAQNLGAGSYVSKPYTRAIIGKAVRDELERPPNRESRQVATD
jgi:signal transduction histidine kinase/ActR/RegA family two-component response regulator